MDAKTWQTGCRTSTYTHVALFPGRFFSNAAFIKDTYPSGTGPRWFDWFVWFEQSSIKSFPNNELFLEQIFSRIDPQFKVFFYPGIERRIRLDEITWGGVRKDGIPALTNPKLISAVDADYLRDKDLVFGIAINGDVRAYPYRIMDWHEMLNDTIGDTPVSLAYCTLCGSGILYKTERNENQQSFIFGSSGFLYRSNKLMYDQETHSLWNQFNGKPVVGPLTNNEIELEVLPLVTTTWKEWCTQHPNTKVLDTDTGYNRDYTPGTAYGAYFNSEELMFPAHVSDHSLHKKNKCSDCVLVVKKKPGHLNYLRHLAQ